MKSAAIGLCAFFLVWGVAQAATLSGHPLAEQLAKGGYVILMRHASSPAAPPDSRAADPANPGLERQLDQKGRDGAAAMGRAVKALHLPIGAVLSSPTYRARETVRLAGLGSPEIFPELGDGGQSMQAGAVAGEAGWLRGKVEQEPSAGTDSFIVTQMPNIAAAFGDSASGLTDGEAMVFKPDGHGAAALVARVKMADWPALAAARSH